MNPTSIIVFSVSALLISAISAAYPDSVFLLAGQSNMAGRGGTYTPSQKWDGVVPEECRSDPRILRLNNQTLWEQAAEPLHSGISFPECSDNNGTSGVGPEIAFAAALLKRVPSLGTIGLVPCAIDGTGIYQWRRGGCLYNHLMARASASLEGRATLRGILWYQGENDSTDEVDAGMYRERLKKFFLDVRTDLMAPTLPIVQVALASLENPSVDEVRRAQLELEIPNVTCIDAASLPLNGNHLHLTTEAQVRLDAMFADAFFMFLTIYSCMPTSSTQTLSYSKYMMPIL